MNEITREKIASKLVAAITDEKLLNKNVAEKFETDAASMSHLKRPENYKKIPARVWNNFRTWYYSDLSLTGFKLPESPEENINAAQAEIIKSAIGETQNNKTEGSKFAGVSSTPYPGKSKSTKELKAESRAAAASLRKEYEKAHPQTPAPKEKQKVDPQRIDIRTGTVITIEAYADHATITIMQK